MPRLSAAMQAVCAAMTASSVASTMLLSSGAGMSSAARHFELSVPTVVICTENEHHFRLCNERLMITGFGKLILNGLIRHVNDGVRHAVAAGRCAHGSGKDNIFDFGCDLLILKNTDGLAVHQNLNRFIHL